MLHVVGRVTEPVARFIGPTLGLLHAEGMAQELMMLEGPALPLLRASLPAGTTLHPVRADDGRRAWLRLRAAVAQRLSRGGVDAVHFHGVQPWLASVTARPPAPPVFLSPHGSHLLGALPLLVALLRQRPTLVATSDRESARLQRLGLIAPASHPVLEDLYLHTAQQASSVPTVVAGSYVASRAALSLFTRVSVLLAEAQPGLAFEWLGQVAVGGAAELDAAGIAHQHSAAPDRIADALGRAWLFLALTPDPRTPLLLAQAMASGTACIALNTPSHSALIRHGHNGLLVRDDASLKAAVCGLLDHPERRQALGEQARADALRLFGPGQLQRGLLAAYAMAPWARPERFGVPHDAPMTPVPRAD